MALFRNLVATRRDSAQCLDFLDLAKNFSFLDWKLTLVPINPRVIRG